MIVPAAHMLPIFRPKTGRLAARAVLCRVERWTRVRVLEVALRRLGMSLPVGKLHSGEARR